jgi:hypothetical protein
LQKLKYITVEMTDKTVQDVVRKIRRELGVSMRLYAYTGLIALSGNHRILELRSTLSENDFLIKVEGPEFLLEEVRQYFFNGGII